MIDFETARLSKNIHNLIADPLFAEISDEVRNKHEVSIKKAKKRLSTAKKPEDYLKIIDEDFLTVSGDMYYYSELMAGIFYSSLAWYEGFSAAKDVMTYDPAKEYIIKDVVEYIQNAHDAGDKPKILNGICTLYMTVFNERKKAV